MADLIDRQAVINEMKDMYTAAEEWAQGAHDDDTRARAESCMATNIELKLRVEKLPSVQQEIIRCKDCKKAPKCYGDVLMASKGGGFIYCPVEYCSEAERKTDE